MRTFFVLSLPRSGTAWLSNFLTWGNAHCFHEVSYGCESLDDIKKAFSNANMPVVGSADTATCMFADKLHEAFPGSKFLIVIRDKEAVRQSLQHNGFDDSGLDMLGRALSDAARNEELDGATIPFEALFTQTGMRQVWEFLEMQGPFPWQRLEMLRDMNIQDVARFQCTTPYAQQKISMNIHRFGQLIQSMYPQQQVWG